MNNKKIALVTGGSRGLGRDMAINIAKKGIDVVLTYNSNEAAAQQVVEEIASLGQTAQAFQLDTRNIKTFTTFAEMLSAYLTRQYGKTTFDFLVNNAGTGLFGSVPTLPVGPRKEAVFQ